MAEVPTFFFSYARDDENEPQGYLSKFFKDLQFKVASRRALDLKKTKVGTIDVRVEQGQDWDADLSSALASNKVLVAVYTPTYFSRPNCGKEFGVFLRRHPTLGLDTNDAISGATNVLPIRWLPEDYYDASVPPSFLEHISDRPSTKTDDPPRKRAISRYVTKGMKRCVNVRPHYDELLDAFSKSIVDMVPLPAASNVSFATAADAFAAGWIDQLKSEGLTVASAPPPAPPQPRTDPGALKALVVYYVTSRPFVPQQNTLGFSDEFLPGDGLGTTQTLDPDIQALVEDVWQAGNKETGRVFQHLRNPGALDTPEPLREHLIDLAAGHRLTVLVVDPAVLNSSPAEADAVENIVRSHDWSGLTLVPSFDVGFDVDNLVRKRQLGEQVVVLPAGRAERISVVQLALVGLRGRVLRTSTDQAPGAEPVPIPRGVGADRT
jgi:hypothetical protein